MNVAERFPRFTSRKILDTLSWSPVVLLLGPRQCGKTTLCQRLQEITKSTFGYKYITFDDKDVLDFANEDPVGFVNSLPTYTILDEVQRVPSIFLPLKLQVDNNRAPGRFLLTGSVHLPFIADLTDSLAGRMVYLTLYPLSRCEINNPDEILSKKHGKPKAASDWEKSGVPSVFLSNLFDKQIFDVVETRTRLGKELATIVVEGGYPVVNKAVHSNRKAWFNQYVKITAFKSVSELTSIRRIELIPRLIELASAHSSQLFNLSKLSGPLGLSRNSVNEYIAVLQNLFMLTHLPAWSTHRIKRTVKTPKLHMIDTGLACALLKLDQETLWNDRKLYGHMVETFVLQELVKQASWQDEDYYFFHYRDRDRDEVDIVIEKSGQGIVAIEVKTRATVNKSDFRSLQKLRDNSENFIAGVVLYDGEWSRSYGKNLYALPISRLWD